MPMNVLFCGDSSILIYLLVRRLLRNGHRVTLLQHFDPELRVSENDNRITDLISELRATETRFSIHHTTTCKPLSMWQNATPRTPLFRHVIFITTPLEGMESPSTTFVRHYLQCLSSLLEGMKLYNPRPIFTLVDKAHDAVELDRGITHVKFNDVMDTAMDFMLYTYWSLYNMTMINMKLTPDIDNKLSIASSTASLFVDEISSSIVAAMQNRSRCEDRHILDGVDKDEGPSQGNSHARADTPAAETGDIVLTTYLTSKKDPQRRIFMPSSNYTYVSEWHLSMRDIGIKAVVFHDGLTPVFRCVCFAPRWLATRGQVYGNNVK